MTETVSTRRQINLERSYRASIEDVWDLWTTKEGIESWWGPEGFSVTVRTLELRAGGHLHYVMTATAPQQIAFMKNAGMPIETPAHITYTEVTPRSRLAYSHLVDFVPGVAPYDTAHLVELFPNGDSVRMLLSIEAMHDDEWTKRAVMGWEGELGKLGRLLATK